MAPSSPRSKNGKAASTSSPASKSATDAHYEKASADLLAAQPSEAPEIKPSKSETHEWNLLRSHMEARLIAMRTWRSSWWFENWSSLAMYLEPRRSIWLTQSTGGWPTPNNMNRGRPINNAIVDPTGTYAVRVCSSGLMSGLASPSRPWFKIVPSVKGVNIDAEGRAWLDEVEDRVYTVLAGSNFYNAFAQECEDLVVFGTAPCIIYEDEKDLIRCYNPCCGEYFLNSSATMRVEGLYRAFVMSIAQIVDYFGIDNCPPEVQSMWQQKGNSLEVELIVGHAIEPNFEIGPNGEGKIPGKFAWREVYWLYGKGTAYPLSKRGFVDQPFTAARWATQSNDAYGRSVGMDVLPDVIQLQVETMRKAEAIEKQVRPPLMAPMELKNQPSSSLPGHVTYVSDTSKGMRSVYDVVPQINEMMQDLAAIQARIKTGLFNDVLLPLLSTPGDRRTAFETSQMIMEKISIMGPVIENIITESLKPKLKRIFGIMQRKQMLPPMPASMKDVHLTVDFISILAIAAKSSATGGLERIAGVIGNLVAVFPEAKDNLDVDNYIRTFSELLDNPQSILHSVDEVTQIRQAQAQQMKQMQQQQEMAQGMASLKDGAGAVATGAQAAQTLAGTEVGPGASALQQLLSGQGQ